MLIISKIISNAKKCFFFQTAVSSTTYALPSSLLPCSSKANATDIGQGPSDAKSSTFMETMKTKLKDLNADEMNQLMHRINEHVRNKIVTQLASQIVQNFDVNQHDSMFNEILSIVDKHNKTI
ncbi:unnamed protein product [Anisakis simplex]|uniref:Enhancer of yellow 2 transcription factor homolog n=1 Tax=Anisakis simplex TaxID=6269 RepID=A0A0M3J3Z5_ANISI|nr:unnamed protein product [Anisakis simplex]